MAVYKNNKRSIIKGRILKLLFSFYVFSKEVLMNDILKYIFYLESAGVL